MTEGEVDWEARLLDLKRRIPPGPNDPLEEYEDLLIAAEVGLLVPTGEIRDGRRIWDEAPHLYSLVQYPPGPSDNVYGYGLLFKLADKGLVRPTSQMRNGRRLWMRVGAETHE